MQRQWKWEWEWNNWSWSNSLCLTYRRQPDIGLVDNSSSDTPHSPMHARAQALTSSTKMSTNRIGINNTVRMAVYKIRKHEMHIGNKLSPLSLFVQTTTYTWILSADVASSSLCTNGLSICTVARFPSSEMPDGKVAVDFWDILADSVERVHVTLYTHNATVRKTFHLLL